MPLPPSGNTRISPAGPRAIPTPHHTCCVCFPPPLQMRQDPELSPSFELPPRSWREAGQIGVGTESEFLEGMKGGLDRCAPAGGIGWTGARLRAAPSVCARACRGGSQYGVCDSHKGSMEAWTGVNRTEGASPRPSPRPLLPPLYPSTRGTRGVILISYAPFSPCLCCAFPFLLSLTLPPPSALCSYLSARGMQPLGSVEWEAYKSHALAEHSVVRQAHEEALREAGHSGFFNSRVR